MDGVQYFEWVEYPNARLRVEIETQDGTPTRFVIQLEARIDGGWRQVARFDHDAENPMGHDITEEGLHMDIYREGERVRVKDDFPPVDLIRAPRYCIAYIREHAETLLRRFEQWHDHDQDPSGETTR
jgi:hypothetical protein